MYRKELTKIIWHRFDAITKLIHKVADRFDEEEIHDLRVDIKKLRSFLKLVRVEPGDRINLKFTGRLRQFNHSLGIIRDLQLQENIVTEFFRGEQLPAVKRYRRQLKAIADNNKAYVVNLLGDDVNFDFERDVILKHVPHKFSKTSIHKFMKRRSNEIKDLLISSGTDEAKLHKLRIVLKSILYNWPYVKSFAWLLPPEMNTRRMLSHLTTILGSFCDQCTALEYLEPPYFNITTEDQNISPFEAMRKILVEQREKYRTEFFYCTFTTFTLFLTEPSVHSTQ